MCGILGIYCSDEDRLVDITVDAVRYLRRRGPDSMGFAFVNPTRNIIIPLKHVTDKSKVVSSSDVREDERKRSETYRKAKSIMHSIHAKIVLAQTRYSTDSRTTDEGDATVRKALMYANSQPIVVNLEGQPLLVDQGAGIQNGNIPPWGKKFMQDNINFQWDDPAIVDTRLLTEVYIQKLIDFNRDFFKAAEWVINNVKGTYSFMFSDGENMVCFKDRYTNRPLCRGRLLDLDGIIHMSEDGFFNDFGGIENEGELQMGQVDLIDKNGNLETRVVDVKEPVNGLCPFDDFIYLKDFGSLCMNGTESVDSKRYRYGELTAEYYMDQLKHINLVLPVPDSGNSYARGFAFAANKKTLGSVRKPTYGAKERNYLVARNSEDRGKNTASHKYSIQGKDIEGKNVAFIDDSIMRGDTFAKLYIEMKQKGAGSVEVYSMWPPNIFKCDKGNDIQTNEELIAYELVRRNIIYDHGDGSYKYDSIEEVNTASTDIMRTYVLNRAKEWGMQVDESFVKDLHVRYSPVDILRHSDIMPEGGCTKCIDGVELPGWTV